MSFLTEFDLYKDIVLFGKKTGNKSDIMKMYRDEKNTRSSENDFIRRNICQR